MEHLMRFLGRFEMNYDKLGPDPTRYFSPQNKEVLVSKPPAAFNGIMFYCMEDMRTRKAIRKVVMVENIKLVNPLVIDQERHTDGKGLGPRGYYFGDNSARNLMIDIVNSNREQVSELGKIMERFFGNGLDNVEKAKSSRNEANEDVYFPTREDFENTLREHYNEDVEVPIGDLLDAIEDDFKRKNRKLGNHWRVITERNIKSWSTNKEEQ